MATQVILLERVGNLGELGEIVNVKPGYARNYLIPQQKALRATKSNIAYFEAQKTQIEKKNDDRRSDADKEAKKLDDLLVNIIRHASESGQLYGSVNARDIAEAVSDKSGIALTRGMVTLHEAFKTIGIFDVTISLHPEVTRDVRVNIARTEEEAKTQAKTGKAMIASELQQAEQEEAQKEAMEQEAEKAKVDLLEDSALEAEKVQAEEDAIVAEKEAEVAAAKAEAAAEAAAAAEAVAAEEAAEAEAAAETEATDAEKEA